MNRGALHLAQAVKAWVSEDPDNRSQNAAAGEVGCDTGNFSKILQGERAPGRVVSHNIFQKFGTEPAWFDQPSEEPAA